MNDWTQKVIDRIGRGGAIAAGVLLAVLFLAFGGPLFLAGLGSSVAGVVVFAACLVGPAIWVLADARRRGIAHPFLWALFALLGNLIGAVVYVIARDDRPATRPCGGCGRGVEARHTACPWCGTFQQVSKRTCTECRSELDLGWRFCPYCRTEQGKPA